MRMDREALSLKEEEERSFWRTSPHERPGSGSLANLLNKFGDARRFATIVERYAELFERARSVLELGGGQGWACALIKRRFPGCRVHSTDLSLEAVASVPVWEKVFDVRLDGAFPCRSYAIPIRDASVDLVFTFAAAHHFVAHRRTLCEIHRVLRPRGACLYLYEPTAPAALRSLALARVRRIQRSLPEDVIVPAWLTRVARETGFDVAVRPYLSADDRGLLKSIYYAALRGLPMLPPLLPCTREFLFTKRATSLP
jgi:SAM-dependent methyltransferase